MNFPSEFLRNDSFAFKMLCQESAGLRVGIKVNQIYVGILLTDPTGSPQASTEVPEAKASQSLLLHTARSVTTLTKPTEQKSAKFQDSFIL